MTRSCESGGYEQVASRYRHELAGLEGGVKPNVMVGVVVALLLGACGERDVSAVDIVDDVGQLEPAPCLQGGTATITAYDRDYVEPTAAQGLRRELRYNEKLPAEQWIRVADDGEHVAYAPGASDGSTSYG